MKNKYFKYIIIFIIIIIMSVLLFLLYKNLFIGSGSSRYENIEKYKLTNDEINSVKDKIKELEEVKSVNVYIDSRIIKIVVKLNEDIDLEKVKEKAKDILIEFSEENLSYYDVEFFVDSLNEESEIYPQIGYKFKTNLEFSW